MNARKNSAGRRGPFFGPVLILALSAAAAAEDFGPPFPAVAPPDFASARQADGPADGEAFGHVPAAEAGLTPSDSLDDLRGRIEALERQNEELLRRLDRDGGPPSGVEAGSGGLDASSDASAVSSTPSGASGTAKVDAGDGWYPIGSDLEMTGSWNNGLEFATRNKDFRVHVGGRIQFDTIFWDGSDAFVGTGPPFDADSFNFRRARLRVDGTMYEWIDWAAEFDFVNVTNENQGQEPPGNGNVVNVPAATELWMNFKGLPYVGNLRAGNFKNPIGMEHLTSSRFLPFIERSFNQDVFYGPFNNGFVPGVMLWDQYAGGRGLWATGVFRETKTPYGFGTDDGSYMWTSRVTYLLWYDECSDGRSLFHVGASNNLIDPIDGAERYRARPSLRNGPPGPLNPVFADTGTFPVELAHHLGFEAAWNYGSLTMQAEYTPGFLHDAAGARGPSAGRPVGDEFIQGGYVQALYFLTGEHMLYDRTLGAFTRVVPHENAYVLKGLRENIFTKGAWQVGFRYAYLDLDSSPALDGGILNDYTFGLNWYFNPNAKVQWNYVLTHRDVPTALGRGGFANGFGMRLAWDF